MIIGRIFLLVPADDRLTIRKFVDGLIVPAKRELVQIFCDESVSEFHTDVKVAVAQRVISQIQLYQPHPENYLFIVRDIKCSIQSVVSWWRDHDHGNYKIQKFTKKALKREIKSQLKCLRWDWESHAEDELNKFDGPKQSLSAWIQQFASIGCLDIGKKIAGQLRIIQTGRLHLSAFRLSKADIIGHRQANCYIEDNDPGGSWNEIKSILTHSFSPETVLGIFWDEISERMEFPSENYDKFIIYEDGLWSGKEAVRRLLAIKRNSPKIPIVFRYGIVTDFGLRVVRHAIRALDLLQVVSIDTSSSELICFLREIPSHLDCGLDLEHEEYFEKMHEYVEPFAFNGMYWSESEVALCEKIGEMLVFNWLSNGRPRIELEDKIKKFRLGGGNFASTVAFSRSIPKVCLPFLWLDGSVELNGKVVAWRPLLVDARRIKDRGLLAPPSRLTI